jgi:hypothetical protein
MSPEPVSVDKGIGVMGKGQNLILNNHDGRKAIHTGVTVNVECVRACKVT